MKDKAAREIQLKKIKDKYQLLGKYIYINRLYGMNERVIISNKNIKDAASDPLTIYIDKKNCFEIQSPHTLDKYINKLKKGEMKILYLDENQEYTFDEYRAYCIILRLAGIEE